MYTVAMKEKTFILLWLTSSLILSTGNNNLLHDHHNHHQIFNRPNAATAGSAMGCELGVSENEESG